MIGILVSSTHRNMLWTIWDKDNSRPDQNGVDIHFHVQFSKPRLCGAGEVQVGREKFWTARRAESGDAAENGCYEGPFGS